MRSKTIRGSVELSIEFQEGTEMQYALQQLQSRIAEARNNLPAGVNLSIERVTPATFFPVLTYNVSSDILTLADLHTIAQYQIRPNLSQVPGVVLVQIQGRDISEVEVQIDPAKLKSYGLSLTQVANALQRSNQELAVGKIDKLYQQNLVVAANQAINPAELEGVVVAALGIGAGSGLQQPLAIAVIGGLSLSAVFTLIFVPVVFRVISEFSFSQLKRKIWLW